MNQLARECEQVMLSDLNLPSLVSPPQEASAEQIQVCHYFQNSSGYEFSMVDGVGAVILES